MKLLGLTQEQARKAVQDGQVTVTVFGQGKMGLPLALCVAEAGARVIGVDVNPERVAGLMQAQNPFPDEPGLGELLQKHVRSGRYQATTDGAGAALQSEVHILLVPTTLHSEEDLQRTPLFAAAREIAKGLKKGDIVITECTVPPGTTHALAPILGNGTHQAGKDFGLAHCPERTMSGTAIRDIRHQHPKIIGSDDDATRTALAGMYSAVTTNRAVVMDSTKEAECVKVFEGVYRFINIGMANELATLCEGLGVNAWRVFAAANTQPYCHLHNPGPGIGGHCIPEYPKFLAGEKTPLINAGFRINHGMPEHVVLLLEENAGSLASKTIGLLGLTYRPGVHAFENTPAEPIISLLKKRGARVLAFDPLCDEMDGQRFGVERLERLADADAVIIVNRDPQFVAMDWNAQKGRVVVDASGLFQGDELHKKGIRHVMLGVGR